MKSLSCHFKANKVLTLEPIILQIDYESDPVWPLCDSKPSCDVSLIKLKKNDLLTLPAWSDSCWFLYHVVKWTFSEQKSHCPATHILVIARMFKPVWPLCDSNLVVTPNGMDSFKNKTKQNKTKQKTKQNKTKQNSKTKQKKNKQKKTNNPPKNTLCLLFLIVVVFVLLKLSCHFYGNSVHALDLVYYKSAANLISSDLYVILTLFYYLLKRYAAYEVAKRKKLFDYSTYMFWLFLNHVCRCHFMNKDVIALK